MLGWIRRWRRWNADHVRAWAGFDIPGPSGLTPFQVRCEAALVEQLARRGVRLANRGVEGHQERYIQAQLGDTAWTVWIYLDQIGLTGPGRGGISLEQWASLTPDELITKFIQHVDALLDSTTVREFSRARDGTATESKERGSGPTPIRPPGVN